jgi:hypothetical protein
MSPSTPAVGPVRLADALGWSSSVLGAPMTVAPRRFLRAIGVEDDPKAVAWTVGVGVREHLATLNIVANRQRRIGCGRGRGRHDGPRCCGGPAPQAPRGSASGAMGAWAG